MKPLMNKSSDRQSFTSLGPLVGELGVPGDKSITHRALILAALARGRSVLTGVGRGLDVAATARILGSVGAAVAGDPAKSQLEVEGCGWSGLTESTDVLDAGNSGTTLRLMLGVLAAARGAFFLSGDASLGGRPMGRIVAPLRAMGATIDGRAGGDRTPLLVRGSELTGVDHVLPVASAQVKSALLLAGLRANGRTTVTEPAASRDHTERMLAAVGVPIERRGQWSSVAGRHEDLAPVARRIPGDISSAMFLVVAATLVPGSDVTVTGVGLNPTRTGALEVLEAMGARIEVGSPVDLGGEPAGCIRVRAGELGAAAIDAAIVPRLVDELPILAIAATQATGETVISGAAELRVKESDRIATVVQGLKILGADVDALDDGLVIRGPCALRGGVVDSHGDHRVALAFAVAGLIAKGKVEVEGWHAVDSSFPEFLGLLDRVGRGGSPR